MTLQALLRKPFTQESYKTYSQALQSAVVLIPLLGVILVNQSIQSPGLFFVGLAAYFIAFMTVGWRFELRRAERLLNRPLPAKFSFGRSFAYAWINILLGTLLCLVTIGWAITLVRNIIFYPFAEWGHAYPDPSWGGPTWQGAIALHTGSAIISLFIVPWILSWLVHIQARLITKLLVREVLTGLPK